MTNLVFPNERAREYGKQEEKEGTKKKFVRSTFLPFLHDAIFESEEIAWLEKSDQISHHMVKHRK